MIDEPTRTRLLESIERVLAGQAPGPLPPAEGPDAAFALASIHFAAGRHHEAVQLFHEAARAQPWRTHALTRVVAIAGALGWDQERFAAAKELRAQGPAPRAVELTELALRGRLGDAEGAADLARRLLAAAPGQLAVRLELANALAASAQWAALRDELAVSARLEPQPLGAQLEQVRLQVEADRCDEAEAVAARAHGAWPSSPLPLVALARLTAWRGDAGAAEAWARRALALQPDSADAWCALGAALQLAGGPSHDAFVRSVELDPRHGEAHVWLAQEAAEAGDRRRLDALLDVAVLAASRQLSVSAWLLRALGALEAGERPQDLSGYRVEEIEDALEELVPGAARELAHVTPARARELLRSALAASGGNRSTQATRVVDGRARRLASRVGPRLASRAALERLRFEPPDQVAARLTALAQQYPRSSMPLVHRGELWLWLGRADQAEADFRAAIARVKGTRFAWIGLTGVELLRGELERALRVCAEGVQLMRGEGPAVFVYRGEALRRLGRLEEAQRDLEAALAASPRRLSASMNLALVHHARGHEAEAQRLFSSLDDCAPALMADARRELGSASAPQAVERALSMMHGNRSSSTVLYESGGALRSVPNQPGSARELSRFGARELRSLAAALRSGLPLLGGFA